MKKAELLSPAGNLEKLKIAIDYGADAVYGGVSHFSLRIRSGKEFSYEEFSEGVEYAHARGKKVYATINGFPFNSQLDLLKKHMLKMAELNVDAFIVATAGVLKLAKETVPHMSLHLSTQANVMNVLDAKVYHEMGATRIITAREISLRDLVEIKKEIPGLELEVFVHGSMCFAYSGRCLISTLQSGRVPNRGSCANDCRFPYELYAANPETGTLFRLEEDEGIGTYIMNSKDLNLASHIKEILDSKAVDSLKIEGRTKTSYYAAITAKAYRMAIDDYYNGVSDSKKYQYELESLQNRGYTDAYLISRPFEKHDTQSLDFTMQLGTHQVCAQVEEDGEYFMCKYKTLPYDELEIVAPLNSKIDIVENEFGKTYEKDGRFYLQLFKLVAKNNKIWDEVHSGNTNPIKLPTTLPPFTFLRIPSHPDMGTYPRNNYKRKKSKMKFVSIIIGSKSDFDVMKSCSDTLEAFGVNYELIISSAHRSPERTKEYVQMAEKKGACVFIAAAGMAAHLAGVLASKTVKPIIGVPMSASALSGIDALLSTVQMPAGMPVATVAIGKAGAINSAYLAMQILALDNEELSMKLKEDRIAKAKQVEMDSLEIETIL